MYVTENMINKYIIVNPIYNRNIVMCVCVTVCMNVCQTLWALDKERYKK